MGQKPTSPRQRQANRRNALKSTGPKTVAGKRRAAANAVQHGLSVPIDPTTAGRQMQALVALLTAEGMPPARAQDLALRILELERNLAHQRQLFAAWIADEPGAAWLAPLQPVPRADRWLDRLIQRRKREEAASSTRYLKRAFNQLNKALRIP